MKKILLALLAGAVGATIMSVSAMAADAVATLNGTEYETVQEAVDAAVVGDNVIQLLADKDGIIDENVFIIQQKGINITFKGSEDIVYTGGFEICGNNRSYIYEGGSPAEETLTFDGINFNGEDKTEGFDFIGSKRKNTVPPNGTLVWGYPHNVTVRNCTFIGNGDFSNDTPVVALRNVGGYNWTIEDCTASNMHSFLQASANTLSSTIDNVTVTNCGSGLNLGTNANYTITNSTFDVAEYAVRADANCDRDVDFVMTGCEINAAEALIFRKGDTAKFTYDVVIENNKIIASVADITRGGAAAAGDTMTFDIDNNYWGGDAPVIDELKTITGAVPEVLPYYKDEDMTQLGGVEAIYDGELYTTLADAIDEAEAVGGDAEITLVADVVAEAGYYSNVGNNGALNSLVIDLDGYTITVNSDWKIFTDITLKNGAVKSEAINGTSPFYVFADAAGKTYDVTFENVDIVSKNNGGFAFISPNGGDADATFKFVNCDIDVSDYASHVSVINAQGGIKVILDKTNITATNGGYVFVNVKNAQITESTITADNVTTAFRNFAGTVTDSEIIVTAAKNGIKNDADLALTIGGDSYVKITGSTEYDINLADTATITVADTAKLYADSVNAIDNITAGENATFVTKADSISVEFVKADVDAQGVDNDEDADLYNINLVGANEEIINRLNSADLTFVIENTTGKTAYEIIASNEEVKINPVNNSDNRYEFHYDGKDGVKTDVANVITIGQVKFSGYGIYTFSVDAEAETNVAHATTISDNIVDTFVPNDDDTTVANGELVIENYIKAEILVPTRDLIINIDFPNAINDNQAAYQDMTVTVSGADLETDLVIQLGENGEITDLDEYITKTSEDKAVTAVFADGAYKVTITDLLNVDTTYTVVVEGAGYRTARYNVTMNCEESKTLNFWNNVKDNAVNVEEKKDSSAKNVTFLAGDIVKDAIINIYDLSAVVSYFGEIDLDENNNKTYAKYDLNRDGKIDSKDVAYVLVSWGK